MKVSEAARKPEEHYTYADYATWPEDQRWELIRGIPFDMSPAPRTRHQSLVGEIYFQLVSWFRTKDCKPFVSPVDVVLPEPGQNWRESDTVVEPDVFVICDGSKIRPEAIVGAPDFIVEVLSPSTARRDRTDKRALYERHGVREYWVLNPDNLEVLVHVLNSDGSYGIPTVHSLANGVVTSIFPGLSIDAGPEFSRAAPSIM